MYIVACIHGQGSAFHMKGFGLVNHQKRQSCLRRHRFRDPGHDAFYVRIAAPKTSDVDTCRPTRLLTEQMFSHTGFPGSEVGSTVRRSALSIDGNGSA